MHASASFVSILPESFPAGEFRILARRVNLQQSFFRGTLKNVLLVSREALQRILCFLPAVLVKTGNSFVER